MQPSQIATCTVCLEQFRSEQSFDRHRYGSFKTADRHWLTPAEMQAAGWRQIDGGAHQQRAAV
jgi:hypothetical protein